MGLTLKCLYCRPSRNHTDTKTKNVVFSGGSPPPPFRVPKTNKKRQTLGHNMLKNASFEVLDFKKFRGSMPPDPSRAILKKTRHPPPSVNSWCPPLVLCRENIDFICMGSRRIKNKKRSFQSKYKMSHSKMMRLPFFILISLPDMVYNSVHKNPISNALTTQLYAGNVRLLIIPLN